MDMHLEMNGYRSNPWTVLCFMSDKLGGYECKSNEPS